MMTYRSVKVFPKSHTLTRSAVEKCKRKDLSLHNTLLKNMFSLAKSEMKY